jgi:DNA-binding beta-propeller fold protein YncE/predicted Ser/Thr protein kinase
VPLELTTGSTFANYRIEGLVGRGGMGVVYRATDLRLERPVALKLIAPELAEDERFRERFLRESRLAASLDHRGVVPIHAAGEEAGQLFIAMRYVEGEDLKTLLRREGALAPERSLAILSQIAEALDAAHERGLVHRDVKPGNVLLDGREHAYLTDFGLTKQLGGASTETGQVVGTFDYLAPEQIRGEAVDARTDCYAFACVLYECLTGSPPFRRPTEAEVLWAHMQEQPPAVLVYPELDSVVRKALAKEKNERYASCGDFLASAASALGLEAPARRARRRRVGGRLVVAGAALIAAAAAAVAGIMLAGDESEFVAPGNAVAAVDPASLELTTAIPVGNTPTEVAASDEWVWVLNANDGAGTISRVDVETRERASTFSVGGTPRNIVAAFGSLWVGTSEGRVFRVEPSTDLVEDSWTLPNAGERTAFAVDQGSGWLAAGPNAIWAGSSRAISRIDPTTSRLSPRTSDYWGPMAYGFGSLWIATDDVQRLAPASARPIATVALADQAYDVETGFGSVWVGAGDTLVRVDPQQEAVVETYDVGGSPTGFALGAGAVWVATDEGILVRIDPDSGQMALTRIGGAPRSVGVGGGVVWASVT